MERDQLKSALESLLFASEGPLTLHRLGEVLEGVERGDIAAALQELQAEYDSGGRGFRLVEVAGGHQMRTARENADWVKKLYRDRPARMTRATLETLAIIAYKQPITRAEIEAIRGVDVDGVVATLLDRKLIRIVARKDIPGRPFLYGTTPEFLQLFNLK
ncbi:MAG TPA: SMC-Scp complex subunit ScpB, partial [Candidatus Binatia bacterium]